jgi:hypothetical protein
MSDDLQVIELGEVAASFFKVLEQEPTFLTIASPPSQTAGRTLGSSGSRP